MRYSNYFPGILNIYSVIFEGYVRCLSKTPLIRRVHAGKMVPEHRTHIPLSTSLRQKTNMLT